MKKYFYGMLPVYCLVLLGLLISTVVGDRVVTVLSENAPVVNRKCYIIDAGHGGVDGGAVSCTGAYESHINLQIALKLNDLMHLLGMQTKMIRTTDISVYTSGDTIAAIKASDLKERVRIVNSTENGVLISIHQNYYSNGRYDGAQVFYANTDGSKELANIMQTALREGLDPGNNRLSKPSEGIYLMKHIQKTGILVECGFLSNHSEEAKLRDNEYQNSLCCVLASVCSAYNYRDFE
jgi:N-acetylmuramoyl-L-alanine amidase